MVTKAALRESMRRVIAGMDEGTLAEKSKRICAQIVASAEWQAAQTVCLFASQSHEPDVELLWHDRAARAFCFPRVNGIELDLLRIENPSEFAMSRWQLREPIHDSEKIVEVTAVDLILVPGVAFTNDGARLGRGGGFYDRLLSRPEVSVRTLGVCFAEQLCALIPTESHDRRMDRVISA